MKIERQTLLNGHIVAVMQHEPKSQRKLWLIPHQYNRASNHTSQLNSDHKLLMIVSSLVDTHCL
jgi:hypothetical protein